MTTEELKSAVDATAVAAAAAAAADDVDKHARFPAEAVDMLREAKLLSTCLPVEFGGRGSSLSDLAAITRQLGAACSSTAMVFAMHHSQALTLRFHAATPAAAELARTVARNEALLASATTEITTGGDVRSSTCAVETTGDRIHLQKNAPVISYGEYADYICTTARRNVDSPPGDQVLVVCPRAETTLERTSEWDTLGFRGTCSPGFMLSVDTSSDNVIPVDYSIISAHTMQPSSHTLWASAWLGIADAAVAKARTEVRAAARRSPGSTPPQAARFAELLELHQRFESSVADGIARYEAFLAAGHLEPTIGFSVAMNNLKLTASTAVVDIVAAALTICGINGYRENHRASMGRLLRDSYGPALMVSNDRIRANNSQLVLALRG